jgi:L-rhamnose mutarotase
MQRHVLMLDLKDDPATIAAYREHHRRVWPEVVESLQRAGIEELEIYLLGRRLVMIVETRDGVDVAHAFATHAASSARVVEWERLMASMQEPVPAAAPGEWWARMEPVFRLTDQASAGAHGDRSLHDGVWGDARPVERSRRS